MAAKEYKYTDAYIDGLDDDIQDAVRAAGLAPPKLTFLEQFATHTFSQISVRLDEVDKAYHEGDPPTSDVLDTLYGQLDAVVKKAKALLDKFAVRIDAQVDDKIHGLEVGEAALGHV